MVPAKHEPRYAAEDIPAVDAALATANPSTRLTVAILSLIPVARSGWSLENSAVHPDCPQKEDFASEEDAKPHPKVIPNERIGVTLSAAKLNF